MRDDFRRRKRADAKTLLYRQGAGAAEQEAGGEQVAGTGRIDDLATERRDFDDPAVPGRDAPFSLASPAAWTACPIGSDGAR